MMTRLPPPEQWVLSKMNEIEVAQMIERHIEYVDENGRAVALPMVFVRHFMNNRDDKLPFMVAISNLPIVLGGGGLLAPDGLDRLRGILFVIPEELRSIIPRRDDCTAEAVKAAMDYLCNEWLVDVLTDYTGKCTIIAMAMTLIERSLLPQRPAFFVTAGKRGGGKTTTIQMLIMAVTGMMAAAAAWSSDENERRKAVLSYFLYGVPYILWDNIPRGAMIDCPHIERSCTTAFYSDRRLGVSEIAATAASTIHIFTGNNIGPKGDLASRSLHVRLATNQPDPENRNFMHSDPIQWTEDNRAEIMSSLYTIMLGNPTLKKPHDAPMRTRYKMWYRMVGSAVEHAARQTGHELDFKKLFLDLEAEDDDVATLSDGLAVMAHRWPNVKKPNTNEFVPQEFTAAQVATFVNDPHSVNAKILRELLCPDVPVGVTVTPKAIGRRLRDHVDAPVAHGDGDTASVLVLRRKTDRDRMIYHVEGAGDGESAL